MTVAANWAAGVIGGVLLYIYAFQRMRVLQFGPHKTSWVLLHVGLGSSAGWVVAHAVHGMVDLQDFACLLASGAWLTLSAESFREGSVPKAAQSKPVPLDTVPMESRT